MNREELIRTLLVSQREIEPGQDFGIELFRPEDALGVCLAYLEAYGDAFPLDYVYDPAEIVRRNASGELYTVVARTPRGEVVGLFGLFRPAPNPGVREAGQLIVRKSYRKRNLATALSVEALENLPLRLGLSAIVCEALTNSVASQHLGEVNGMAFTGLEVECMPAVAAAGANGADRNISLLLMFKVFGKSPCAAHLPEAYRAFCEAAYAEMALPRTILPAAPPTDADTLAASPFVLPQIGLVRQTIQRCGKDFPELVDSSEAMAGEHGMVQLCLNLGDPAAPQATEALRRRGYFLAGLLPCWFGTDGLAMQKVGREPDWEAIQVCSPKADAVRRMVRDDFERAQASRGA
jgi:GNAT superfamily N-acetyltransferase